MSDACTLPGPTVTALFWDCEAQPPMGLRGQAPERQKGAAAPSAGDRRGSASEALRPAHVFVPEPFEGRP